MDSFFTNLEKTGFKNTRTVKALKPLNDKGAASNNLSQSLPKEYLKVITGLYDIKRRNSLLNIANNINLFLKTKFNETNIYHQWSSSGTIPFHYHNGLNSKHLSFIAHRILKIRERLIVDRQRVSELESKDKANKRQVASLEKAYQRIHDNEQKLKDYEETFYFEFVDFESSLGGIY